METVYETQRDEQGHPIQVATGKRMQFTLTYPVHTSALTDALKAALPGKVIGVNAGGVNRPVEVLLALTATDDDEPAITATVMAHDPVFIVPAKDQVLANGVDMVIVGINAPKPGAAPVTLQMAWKPGVQPAWNVAQDWAIPLTDGAGFDHMTANDRGTVAMRVKNGTNRSNEVLKIACL